MRPNGDNQNEERPRITRAQIKVKSKISCLSFSRKHVSHIAASDYEGVVTIWDAETSQSILKFEEHDKRGVGRLVLSMRGQHAFGASGSDDGAVSGNRSVMEMQMRKRVLYCVVASDQRTISPSTVPITKFTYTICDDRTSRCIPSARTRRQFRT